MSHALTVSGDIAVGQEFMSWFHTRHQQGSNDSAVFSCPVGWRSLQTQTSQHAAVDRSRDVVDAG